jgi:adenosylhomocysteine nucleosidase
MSGVSIAIVAALPEEVRPLRARLLGARRLPMEVPLAVRGVLAGQKVALVVTGDGERNARVGIEALLEHLAVERLLVIGVAGALTSDLHAGAVIVAAHVRSGGASFLADPALVEVAVRRGGCRPATVITSDQIADSPAERVRLLRAYGQEPGSAAVDLESSVFVRAAVGRSIPWLVMRAISDTADERLPALINRSREEGGAVRRGALVRGLLMEPTALPTLLSLRWRVGRCAQALATATERLLGAEWGTGAAA